MQEHPDIEELFRNPLDSTVANHLENCLICRQILEDSKLLATELAQLNEPAPISEKTNSQIQQDISARAKVIRQQIFRKNLAASLVAIAAILILTVGIFNWQSKTYIETADINNDGEINVLDSFVFAKKLANKETITNGDLDHNGKSDEEDLKLLRNQIVGLEKEWR